MSRNLIAIFIALAVAANAVPLNKEAVDQSKWELVREAENETLTVTFALPLRNTDWLEKFVLDVSNPLSKNYGEYMTWESLAKHVHASDESVNFLQESLISAGVHHHKKTIDRGFLVTEGTASAYSAFFQSKFYVYRHRELNVQVTRSPQASIPTSLQNHVSFASGHKLLPREKDLKPEIRLSKDVDNLGVSPSSIDTAYNMSLYTSSNPHNSQAVASFLKQYFRAEDLAKFQEHFKLPIKPITKIVGVDKDKQPGAEANLDVQFIGVTGRSVSTWFVSTGGYDNHGQERFLTWIVGQSNTTDSPWVHSVSYGDVESSIDIEYLDRVDQEFQKFGATGRTVLVASGDGGVGCKSDKQVPNWPTSSPWVTSVGGTSSDTAVWTDGGSGFSDKFGMPEYQREAVTAYLNSGSAPDTKYFNVSGRAYPDVAAFATNFPIIFDGVIMPVDGTSCATPTFAGVVSVLNDVRLNSGKKTLGFLNPTLYSLGKSNPEAFNDITDGSNPSYPCPGFNAAKGWDASSGFGSPNFGIMKNLV